MQAFDIASVIEPHRVSGRIRTKTHRDEGRFTSGWGMFGGDGDEDDEGEGGSDVIII